MAKGSGRQLGATYTPGPWTTEAKPHRAFIGQVGVSQESIWTERQFKVGESYEWGSAQADAQLIAAAPELLEALVAIREEGVYSLKVKDIVSAAIAKATGGISVVS